VLQGRVEAQKIRCGGEYNIRFVANFLRHVTAKKYGNWFTNKKVIAKNKKGIVFRNRVYRAVT